MEILLSNDAFQKEFKREYHHIVFKGLNAHYLERNLHAKCQNNQRESLKCIAHNVLRQS